MHWCPVFQDEANECDAPLSPMASGVHVDQALAHIKERIQELCEEFKANDEAINDDSTTLNKFCSELELVLQHGQKALTGDLSLFCPLISCSGSLDTDKTFLLNVSKGYWGYFCRCLAGEKSLKGFSALKYAKSLPEFKSRSLSPVVFKISPPDVCRAAPFLVVKTASSQTECCLPDRVAEAEATATACSEKLEKMAEEWRAKEQAWLEKEALMQGELESLRASQPGETACVQSSCKSCDDLKEVVQRLSVEKDDLTTKNNFLARKLNEVLEKLEDSEETINTLKQSETELRTRIEKLSFVNEGLKNLVDAVKDEATILRQQILIMDKEVKSSHELLEQKKMQCKGLEDQLVKLRSKCCESINASAVKDREIEKLASLVRLARRRLFSKTPAMHQSDASLEESSKISPDNSMSDEALLKMLSSEEMEESGIPAKQTSRTESSNCELFEHCLRYLGSAMLHHESLIDRANAKVRDIISTSHSINLQLHVMQEVLSMQHAKEDGGSAEGDISVTKEVTGPSEELVPPRIEGCDFVTSLFETMCRNHSKMQSLMQSESHLEKELADCRELNRLLSSKVHEQERKLCGFVQELDRTKILLVGMEQTHHKLQTAKAVMRYELQEKKNLLHNLRQQLESTRENCVKVMRSNAESEIEWKSLREEFQSRKKQDSQDSGVSDNGQSTREQTPSSSEDCSERDDPESAEDDDHSDSVEDIPEEGAQFIPEQVADFECKYRARSQRLEYLEQQCQILYNSLVRSSERRNNLQRRLHSLLEGGGTSSSETVVQPVLSDSAPSIPVEPDDSGSREGVVDEEDCDAASDDVSFCEEDSDEVMDGALPEIRKKTLDTIVGRVKLERSQSEEVISNLRATIEQLQTANERLRQQVSNLVEEKAQREKEMRQRASGMLRTERSLKSVQMQEISRERGELLLRNKELEQQLEQKDMQITRIDASRLQSIEKQQMLEKELGTLTEKLQDQAASNSRLYTNYVTQQAVIQEMRERLEDQERMIEELEQCVEDLKQDQVIEQTNFAEELRVQADVDKECGERLKQQLDQSSAQVASCEEQLSQLRMDTVELKKKIVKLVRSFPRLRRPQFLQSGASSLTESDSCAKQEFDIISDEEIARSLLACSPYNSSPKTSHDPALFHMSGPRTMDEIAQCGPAGLRGEVWVNAGGRYSIPVQLAVPKTVLFWEFRCEPKSISFEMRYKPLNSDAELEMMDVILSMVRVQADVQPAEGSLLVKNAGVYVLVFDNQHSK
ncbi:hypothetical protein V5799_009955 [Amblyomma americanum]|uniref:GOLD domain-containing protein n=1 Tax=Amblyomma americanum TaxID=6943 RepID=A0AAQ4FAP8_AMBAM